MNKPSDNDRPTFDFKARDEAHWRRLNGLVKEEGIGLEDMLGNFPAYVRRRDLPRMLAHYELFKQVIDLPGCILELGVYKGASFFTWTKLMETFCPGDRSRRVYGFDHFEGLVDFTNNDGAKTDKADKQEQGWKASAHHARTLVELHNDDNFLPGEQRCVLVEGNVLETLPHFLEAHPGLRISLLYLDMDLYKPTLFALEQLYPLVVTGGVVAFDEYGLIPWAGESNAVDEYFAGRQEKPLIKSFPFSVTPAGYLIK